MINKLVISSESSNLFTTKEFLRAGKELKLNTIWLNPYEECFLISNKEENISLSKTLYLFRTSGIRYDDFDLNVAKKFELINARIANPLQALSIFRNKDFQQFFFKKEKIAFIPSISMRGILNEEKNELIHEISKDENYILKMSRGNGGVGVQIIHGYDSLISILETFHALKDQKFLIQPFIESESEYRFLFTKFKTLAIIEKSITGNNFRANAKRTKTKLRKKVDPELLEFAENCFMRSGLDYAGIDIIRTANGYLVLEINAVPGFENVCELTKLDIAKELILDFLK